MPQPRATVNTARPMAARRRSMPLRGSGFLAGLLCMLAACASPATAPPPTELPPTPEPVANSAPEQAEGPPLKAVYLNMPSLSDSQRVYIYKLKDKGDTATAANRVALVTPVKMSAAFGTGPAPAPFVALPVNDGAAATGPTTFKFIRADAADATKPFGSCFLTVDTSGALVEDDGCGAVGVRNEHPDGSLAASDTVVLNLGAGFPTVESGLPAGTSTVVLKAPLPPRTFTFKNHTDFELCIIAQDKKNLNPAPVPSAMCGAEFQYRVPAQADAASDPGTTVVSIPHGGLNSGAWIVAGFRDPSAAENPWQQTGFDQPPGGLTGPQAAVKFEPTYFSYMKDATTVAGDTDDVQWSVGTADVDASMVDGFNVSYRLYPTLPGGGPAVCNIQYIFSTAPQPVQFTSTYDMDHPLSAAPWPLPAVPAGTSPTLSNSAFNAALAAICPDGHRYRNDQGDEVGCASPCTVAHANDPQNRGSDAINQSCCIGPFGTHETCAAASNPANPAASTYTTKVHESVKSSYAFAYDDQFANFGCDPLASFVVDIFSVGSWEQ